MMKKNLGIPDSVQQHIMLQLMSGNDVEIRLIDGEFMVISMRKKIEKFGQNRRENKGTNNRR